MQLTQKETMLLQDLKTQEQLCIEKYRKYSAEACDEQLKELFESIGRTEQSHLDSINQMLGGTVPSTPSGGGQQQQSGKPAASKCDESEKKFDAYLCQDALSMEKHVSSAYNTSIFEFKDAQARELLNHIQKEEQQHGKRIYDYMAVNGMYS